MEVRTDLPDFAKTCKDKSVIPDDECFIAPVVEILAPMKTKTSAYILRIPHCLSPDDDKSKVKVRLWHENRYPPHNIEEVPPRGKCTDGVLFYDINSRDIVLHTTHFCKVICTIRDKPQHCLKRVVNFCFANHKTNATTKRPGSLVEVRPFFCCGLYKVMDFEQVCQSFQFATIKKTDGFASSFEARTKRFTLCTYYSSWTHSVLRKWRRGIW